MASQDIDYTTIKKHKPQKLASRLDCFTNQCALLKVITCVGKNAAVHCTFLGKVQQRILLKVENFQKWNEI